MIRSSRHSLKFCNRRKFSSLISFIKEYRRISILFIDWIWEKGEKDFIPKNDKIQNCPKYFDYRKLPFSTDLSARALRTLTTQVLGVLRGTLRKRSSVLYLLNSGKISKDKSLILLNKYPLRKPDISNIRPTLNSICCDFKSGKKFDIFVSIKSIGKIFGKINIPIKETKVSQKWIKNGKRCNFIELSENEIKFSYEIKKKAFIKNGQIIGIDQGVKNIITCSDGQTTPHSDKYGYSFDKICDKLSRKKKGSKSFRRTQAHRKNFLNWSLNQIDFSEIKEIHLEKIYNIGHGKRRSRKLLHFTNTLIRDKIKRIAEELEVPVIEQSSSYRSQRCSKCGSVRKANRKGRVYTCKNCGNIIDADLNASLNHVINLPDVPWSFSGQKLNLKNGFFWKPEGLFNFDGSEITVPNYKK